MNRELPTRSKRLPFLSHKNFEWFVKTNNWQNLHGLRHSRLATRVRVRSVPYRIKGETSARCRYILSPSVLKKITKHTPREFPTHPCKLLRHGICRLFTLAENYLHESAPDPHKVMCSSSYVTIFLINHFLSSKN